jgi:hypothetical protein
MTTTALALADELAKYDLPGDGMEDILPPIPHVSLTQGTTAREGSSKHAGEFYHADIDSYTPTLDVVVISRRLSRALFEPEGEQPICSANELDGLDKRLRPRPESPLWTFQTFKLANGTEVAVPSIAGQPAHCDTCPLSMWFDDAPPPCKESWNLLVDRSPMGLDMAMLRLSGTSIAPFRAFVKRVRAEKLPIYAKQVSFASVEKSKPSRKWHELTVVDAVTLDVEKVIQYGALISARTSRAEELPFDTETGEIFDEVQS